MEALSDSSVITRLLVLDDVAGFDVDFDDIDVLEVADIGYFYFDETHSCPLQT